MDRGELAKVLETFVSTRFLMVIFVSVGTFLQYAQRVSFPMAIICMTNNTAMAMAQNHSSEASQIDGEFLWDANDHAQLNSGFYYGYVLGHLPMGLIIQKVGAKWPGFVMLFGYGIISIISPYIAKLGISYFVAVRALSGLIVSGWYPSIYYLIPKWIILEERGRMTSIGCAGSNVGSIFAMPLAGIMCASSLGYLLIFQSWGVVSIGFAILWAFIVYDSPFLHPRISQRERDFLHSKIDKDDKDKHAKMKLPIISMLKSISLWAYATVHYALDWSLVFLLTSVPTYMKDVLQFSLQVNAMLSSLPYVGLFFGTLAFGFLSDLLITRSKLSLVATRKLVNSLALFPAAIFFSSMSFLDAEQKFIAVTLLVLSLFFTSGSFAGAFMTPMDVAAPYASLIFSFVNCIANTSGFFVPRLIAYMTPNSTAAEWRFVFYLTGAIIALSATIFLIFAKADPEPWLNQNQSKSHKNSNIEVELPLNEDKKSTL
ncbi:hypothetical protein Ciccas_003991 [Cichlidogyrus casuarinus]|uniref:Major facilitator superfamily (MFS) profile domain-containing protein n=1 Tax=Cichlidogyrus casuarinus TaxID=1844966 RepID=A0ABD2QD90_9PLAT